MNRVCFANYPVFLHFNTFEYCISWRKIIPGIKLLTYGKKFFSNVSYAFVNVNQSHDYSNRQKIKCAKKFHFLIKFQTSTNEVVADMDNFDFPVKFFSILLIIGNDFLYCQFSRSSCMHPLIIKLEIRFLKTFCHFLNFRY